MSPLDLLSLLPWRFLLCLAASWFLADVVALVLFRRLSTFNRNRR